VVTLVPFTRADHEAYVAAQTLDYAEWLVEWGDARKLNVALDRARAEIEPEVAAALADGDELWGARDAGGATVGWLWLEPGYAPQAAFL